MLAYRLALASGTLDADAILDRPATWFNGWRRFWEADPWGGDRGDLQAAYMASASLAPWRKNPSRVSASDFLPSFQQAQRESMESMKATFARAKRVFAKRQK